VKSTGIVRKVDELGRIVIPIEMRRTLDVAERDDMEIFVEGNRIILQKHESSCIFCSATQGLVTFKGKNICRSCVRNISKG